MKNMIVGVAISVGQWFSDPLVVGLFWCGVLILVAWIVLLAFADALMTKVHFDSVQREQHSELRVEIKRYKESQDFGAAGETDNDNEQQEDI